MSTEKFFRTTISAEEKVIKAFKRIAKELDIHPSILMRDLIFSWVKGNYRPRVNFNRPPRVHPFDPTKNQLSFNLNFSDALEIKDWIKDLGDTTKITWFFRSLIENFLLDWPDLQHVPAYIKRTICE